MSAPGLDGFDEDAAAQTLASVGQQYQPLPGYGPVAPVEYGPPAELAAPPQAAAGPPVPGAGQTTQTLDQQVAADQKQIAADAPLASMTGGSAPPEAANPDAPPATGDAVMPPTADAAPQGLPPVPEPPPPTGDPQQDIQNNIAYSRQLAAHRELLSQHQAQIGQAQAGANSEKAKAELDAERQRAAQETVERERYAKERDERQAAIDSAVKERGDAAKDLEGSPWSKQTRGSKIMSLIAIAIGGRAAQLSNIARVQLHQAPDAQNEALNAINKEMADEYQRRKDRLASASAGLLEARYGFKDAADNHRAALNDLDADTSAKYRLIAKEAEDRLRRAGAGQAEIDQSAIVNDARQKAAASENEIHLREEAALEKKRVDQATIDLDKAKANHQDSLADYRRGKPVASTGGHGAAGHAGGKVEKDELKDIENAAKPYTQVIEGSARSPGIKTGYDSAVSVSNELKKAAASGDPSRMKIAVLHAQEQSTRMLTGSAPTDATYQMQHELQGSADDLMARIGKVFNDPTESKAYVERMQQNIDAIAQQRKEMLVEKRKELDERLGSIAKSDTGRARVMGLRNSLFHGIPEDEATPAARAPKAPADVIDAARAAAKGTGSRAESARKFLDQQGIMVL